jgi:nucleoside 2-deoxyribosyltransferase
VQSELSQFLKGILDHACELLMAEGASIFLLDGMFLRLAASTDRQITGTGLPRTAYSLGEGVTGLVARSRRPIALNDYREFTAIQPSYDHAEGESIKNMLAAPIVSGEKLIGVIRCTNKKAQFRDQPSYTSRDLEMVDVFARSIAVAIESRRELERTLNAPYIFVLMPFHADFRDTYELGIKAVAVSLGLRCERVDEIEFNDIILEQIWKGIQRADIIIADMSGRNPNVFYEVGYAHALRKDVVLLTRDASDIPFDLLAHNHIVYNGRITQLRTSLEKRLSAWVEKRNRSGIDDSANHL